MRWVSLGGKIVHITEWVPLSSWASSPNTKVFFNLTRFVTIGPIMLKKKKKKQFANSGNPNYLWLALLIPFFFHKMYSALCTCSKAPCKNSVNMSHGGGLYHLTVVNKKINIPQELPSALFLPFLPYRLFQPFQPYWVCWKK